jgi:hypothetical protein
MPEEQLHGLGRKPSPEDERDKDWPVERLMEMVEAGVAVPVSWLCRVLLDQDNPTPTGHCVGFAGADWEATDESGGVVGDCTVDNAEGHKLYYLAKIEDGEPDQENGSCARSLAKALQKLGIIDHYSITGFLGGKAWVRNYGAVPIGTNWWSSMDSPNAEGVVTIGGYVRGGHETVWHETDQPYGNGNRNSWGAWGFQKKGDYRTSDADQQDLIDKQGGDVLCMVKLIKPAPTPPPAPTPTPTPPPQPPAPPPFLRRLLHWITTLWARVFSGSETQ